MKSGWFGGFGGFLAGPVLGTDGLLVARTARLGASPAPRDDDVSDEGVPEESRAPRLE